MKPFNLEQALAGAPVITRDGTKVIRLIELPEEEPQSRLVAVLEDGETATFNEGGRYYSMRDSSLDLFMAPTKKEGFSPMTKQHNDALKYLQEQLANTTDQKQMEMLNYLIGCVTLREHFTKVVQLLRNY